MGSAAKFLIPMIVAAAGALISYSAIGAVLNIEPILSVPATSIAYEAFTISVWPVYALMAAVFFMWERAGRKPSVPGYLIGAPFLAASGLALYFNLFYGFAPRLPDGAAEMLFLASVAFGSALFAGMRRLTRR
ncbi:MAG: hypothetical protein R3C60_06070 [Parvularculaceae bacterium]